MNKYFPKKDVIVPFWTFYHSLGTVFIWFVDACFYLYNIVFTMCSVVPSIHSFGRSPYRRLTLPSVAALIHELARSPGDTTPLEQHTARLDESGTFQIDWTIFDTSPTHHDDTLTRSDSSSEDCDFATPKSQPSSPRCWSMEEEVPDISKELFQSPRIALAGLVPDDYIVPDATEEHFPSPRTLLTGLQSEAIDEDEFYTPLNFRPRSQLVRSFPCGSSSPSTSSACTRRSYSRGRRRSQRCNLRRSSVLHTEENVIPEEPTCERCDGKYYRGVGYVMGNVVL